MNMYRAASTNVDLLLVDENSRNKKPKNHYYSYIDCMIDLTRLDLTRPRPRPRHSENKY